MNSKLSLGQTHYWNVTDDCNCTIESELRDYT